MKYLLLLTLCFLFVSSTLCKGQNQPTSYYPVETTEVGVVTSHGPLSITRNIKQDRNGNIWIAAFDGVFQFNGKSFTNIISEVSKARFFDVLEDKKGNFWFSSIGSGVYYYDPSKTGEKSFQHFTTKDGLANDRVPHIYEDKKGDIWFGTGDGASRYDGKSFRNYQMNERLPNALINGSVPDADKDDNDVNSIVEDKNGKFWFGTRGKAYVYDGMKFTVLLHNGEPFINVRTIMEDKKGNIWFSGGDGLWRYDGTTFTNFTKDFVGYVYEDRQGNIWTTSQPIYTGSNRWALSRYDEKSLANQKPTVTDIMSEYEEYKNMLFGILEANDGSIWFGTLGGVYRYDGKAITAFKDK